MLGGVVVLVIDTGNVIPSVSGPIIIESDDDWVKYNFQGTGSKFDPYIIDKYVIKTDEDHSIFISDTEKSFVIRNCIFKANKICIYIKNVESDIVKIHCNQFSDFILMGVYVTNSIEELEIYNNKFTNYDGIVGICLGGSGNGLCKIYNNSIYSDYRLHSGGIFVEGFSSTLIENNTIQHCLFAIGFSGSNVLVQRNYLCNNEWGITPESAFLCNITNNLLTNNKFSFQAEHSYQLIISNNIIENSGNYSMNMRNCGEMSIIHNIIQSNQGGLAFYGQYFTLVGNNTFFNNTLGIHIYDDEESFSQYGNAINNTLSFNRFENTTSFAVYLGINSNYTLVYGNSFISNYFGGSSQAYDVGANNYWYNPLSNYGNYWKDWIGSGSYQIAGSASSEDLYPLDEAHV
jgi:nitrous oxidase accessory protein NosD